MKHLVFALLSFLILNSEHCFADHLDSPAWRSYSKERKKSPPVFVVGKQPPHQSRRGQLHPHASFKKSDNHEVVGSILSRAHELIGTPYRLGGMSASKGFDCSGLLVYLFKSEADLHLPRTTHGMINRKGSEVLKKNLQPGDAVFFSRNKSMRATHVGLYIGGGRFIHSPRTGKSIRVDSMKNTYWNAHYVTARRFLKGSA